MAYSQNASLPVLDIIGHGQQLEDADAALIASLLARGAAFAAEELRVVL